MFRHLIRPLDRRAQSVAFQLHEAERFRLSLACRAIPADVSSASVGGPTVNCAFTLTNPSSPTGLVSARARSARMAAAPASYAPISQRTPEPVSRLREGATSGGGGILVLVLGAE